MHLYAHMCADGWSVCLREERATQTGKADGHEQGVSTSVGMF